MRDLVLRIITVGDTRLIQVVCQSFMCSSFSETGKSWCASNGFVLISSTSPEVRETGYCVRGAYGNSDRRICMVPPEYGDKWINALTEAVREYNSSRSLIISKKEVAPVDEIAVSSRLIS